MQLFIQYIQTKVELSGIRARINTNLTKKYCGGTPQGIIYKLLSQDQTIISNPINH